MGIVTDIFLPLALAFIMFALGLGLAGADFLRVLKQPKDYVMGTPITTDWYSGQDDKERERIWKDAGDAWWKAYGIRNFDELYTEEISQLPEGTRDVNGYYMDK